MTIVALAIPGLGGKGIPERLTVPKRRESDLTTVESSVDDNVGRVRMQRPCPVHCRDAGRSSPAREAKRAVTANGN